MDLMRYVFLFMFVTFSAFTIYCILKENFWKSCRIIFAKKWGVQVTADLYIGLFIFLFFTYLNEGSLLITLLWAIPTLLLGNIVPLLYVFLNFGALFSHFI